MTFDVCRSPYVTGLSQETVFGIEMPFDLRTCQSTCAIVVLCCSYDMLNRCDAGIPIYTSYVYSYVVPLAQHPHRARPRIRADDRFPWKGSGFLEAICRGMGRSPRSTPLSS